METPVGEMVASTLGLLAFILGFTFGQAASRFDTKRQLLVDEANAIGTTWLRAEMLPERRDEIRALLRDYVDVRIDAITPDKLAHGIRRSEDVQNRLWALTAPIAVRHPDSVIVGLFVQTLNEMVDLHTKRLNAAVRNRIPFAIRAALYGISVVIVLIADLDRSQEGVLRVSPQALIDLRQSMK